MLDSRNTFPASERGKKCVEINLLKAVWIQSHMETVVIEQNVSKNNEYTDVLGLVMGRFKKQIENDINRINVRQAHV